MKHLEDYSEGENVGRASSKHLLVTKYELTRGPKVSGALPLKFLTYS